MAEANGTPYVESKIKDLGEAIHILTHIRAKADGARALIGLDGKPTQEEVMSVYFLLDQVGKDLQGLANQLDIYELHRQGKEAHHGQQ